MPANVDEKVVKMEFDNDQFEKGVSQTLKSLDDLKKSLNFEDATKSLDSINQNVNKIDFTSLNNALEATQKRFSLWGEMSAAAIERVTNKVLNLAENMVKSLTIDQVSSGWAKYESVLTSTRTMMTATGASAEDVGTSLKKLMTFADETSYSYQQMADSMGKFAAKGFGGNFGAQAVEDARQVAEGIATWAAQAGQNAATANRVLYQMSQISGWMKQADWASVVGANMATKQFEQMAIAVGEATGTLEKFGDAWQTTEKAQKAGMEVTTENFAGTLTEGGWLTTEVFTKTMQMYNSYFDTTEQVIADGLADNIYDAMDILDKGGEEIIEKYGDWTAGLNKVVADALKAGQISKTFTDAIDATKDNVSTSFTRMFQTLFGDVNQAATLWSSVTQELYDNFAAPLVDIADLFQEFSENAGFQIKDESSDLNGLNYITAGFYNLFEGLSNIMLNVQDAFKNLIPPITLRNIENFSKKWLDITTAFKESTVFKKTSDLLEEFGERVKDIKNEVVNGASVTTQELSSVATVASDNLSSIVDQVIHGDFGNAPKRFSALLEAGYNYYKVQNGVNEKLGDSWRYSADQIEEVEKQLGKVTKAANPITSSIKGITKQEEEATTQAQNLAQTYYQYVDSMINQMSNADKFHITLTGIADALGLIVDAAKAIWENGIKPIITAAVPKLMSGILTITAKLGNKISEFRDHMTELKPLSSALQKISGWLKDIYDKTIKIVDQVKNSAPFKKFVDNLASIGNFLKNTGSTIIGTIGDFFRGFNDQAAEETADTSKVAGAVSNAVFNPLNKIIEFLKPAGRVISSFFDALRKAVGNIDWGAVFDKIEDVASVVGSFLGKGLKSAINLIKGLGNGLRDLWGASKLSDFAVLGDKASDAYWKLDELGNLKLSNLTSAFQKLKSFDIAGFLSSIPMLFGNLAKNKGTIRKTTGLISDFTATATDSATGAEGFAKIWGEVVDKLQPVTAFFAGPFGAIKEVLGPVGEAIKNLFDDIKDGLSNLHIEDLVNVLSVIAGLKIAFSLSKLAGSLADIGSSLSGFFKSLKNTLTRDIKINQILQMSFAFGIIAASLYAMSKIPVKQLWNEVWMLTILFGELLAATIILDKINMVENSNTFSTIASGGGVIALAAAIVMIAGELQPLSEIDWGTFISSIGKIGVIGVLLGALTLIFNKINAFISGSDGFNKRQFLQAISTALTMYVFANSIKKVVEALVQISQMPLDKVQSSMGVLYEISGLMIAISVASKLTGGFSNGLGLLAAAASLWLFAKALLKIADIDFDKIRDNIKNFIVVFGLLTYLAILARGGGAGWMGMAATFLSIGIAVKLITSAIRSLGRMDRGDINKATGALSEIIVMMGLFGLLMTKGMNGKGGMSGTQYLGMFIGMGLAVDLIASGIKKLAGIKGLDLLLATAAISGIMFVMATVVRIMSGAKKAQVSMIAIGILIVAMAASLWMLAELLEKYGTEKFLIAAGTLAVLFGELGLIFAAASKCTDKHTIAAIALIALIIAEVAGIIWVLNTFVGLEATVAICQSLAEVFGGISAMMIAVAVTSKLVPPNASMMGVVKALGIVALIVGALGALSAIFYEFTGGKSDGAVKAINGFMAVLKAIFAGIGEAVGAAVGGIFKGATEEVLSTDLSNLSKLMEDIKSFIEDAKNIASSESLKTLTMFTGVMNSFSLCISSISQAAKNDIDEKLLNGNMNKAGDAIIEFAKSLDGIEGYLPDLVAGKVASSSIADIFETIPAEQGLFQRIFLGGGRKWSDISEGLADYGKALISYAQSVDGIGDYQSDIEASIEASRPLSDFLTNDVPPDPSLFASIFTNGSVSWLNIAIGLAEYGSALKSYATSVSGIGQYQESIDDSITISKSLVDLLNIIPHDPSFWDSIFGDGGPDWNVLSGVDKDGNGGLKGYGDALKSFADSISGISDRKGDFDIAIPITASLNGILQHIPGKSDWDRLIGLDINGDYKKGSLPAFGAALKAFAENVGGISGYKSDVDASIDVVGSISNLFTRTSNASLDPSGFITFVNNISKIGSEVKKFQDNTVDITMSTDAPVFQLIDKFMTLIPSEGQFDFDGFDRLGTALVDITNGVIAFEQAAAVYDTDASANVFSGLTSLYNISNQFMEDGTFDKLSELGTTIISTVANAMVGQDNGMNVDGGPITVALRNAVQTAANAASIDTVAAGYLQQAAVKLVGNSDGTGFIGGITSAESKIRTALQTTIIAAIGSGGSLAGAKTGVYLAIDKYFEAGKKLIGQAPGPTSGAMGSGLIGGISSQKNNLILVVGKVAADAAGTDGIQHKSIMDAWYKAGWNLVDGLVKGFNDNKSAAIAAARTLGSEMNKAYKEEVDERSPSHLWAKYGSYLILGLVNGITDETPLAIDTVAEAAAGLNNAIYEAVNATDSILDESLNPVITPVVDMGGVSDSISSLNGMFGTRSFDLATNIQNGNENREAALTQMTAKDSSATPSMTFVQNNYSPKALSRIDIYRDSKTLFAQAKEGLDSR